MKTIIKILDKYNIKYEIKDNKIYLEDTILYLSNKNIEGFIDVSMIENLEHLNCSYNYLTEIIYNENLQHLHCYNNNLTEINCNDNLIELCCNDNNITKIICNENLQILDCSENRIVEIVCNDNLKKLFCNINPIIKLNRNNIIDIISDIYIYNNEYYCDEHLIRELKNIYFIRCFENTIHYHEILYVYHNYTVDHNLLYKLLNEKYN